MTGLDFKQLENCSCCETPTQLEEEFGKKRTKSTGTPKKTPKPAKFPKNFQTEKLTKHATKKQNISPLPFVFTPRKLKSPIKKLLSPFKSRDHSLKKPRSPKKPKEVPVFFEEKVKVTAIEGKELVIGELIGRGGFGAVYQALYDGHLVAFKEFYSCHKNMEELELSIVTEGRMNFEHPNIVKIIKGPFYYGLSRCTGILMEFGGRKNLGYCILEEKHDLLSGKLVTFIAIQILSALSFLQERELVHLDIKPQNVLVDKNYKCRIGDFGCSEYQEKQQDQNNNEHNKRPRRSSLNGTYTYKAPEILRGECPTPKADIFSFGVLLNELLTLEQPYDKDLHPHYILFAVVTFGLRPDLYLNERHCPVKAKLAGIAQKCWASNPEDRPMASVLHSDLSVWIRACLANWNPKLIRKLLPVL